MGPSLDVVTCDDDRVVSALAVYTRGGFYRVLVRGPDAPCQTTAMQKLLAMTSEILVRNLGSFEGPVGLWYPVRGDGNSYYYAPDRL